MSKYIDLDQVEFLKTDGNKEFNHGVDCCINKLMKQECVQVIPLDKVKKVREKISENVYRYSGTGEEVLQGYCDGFNYCLKLIDNLIESEE